jgi:hypothetical protein
MSQDSWQHPQQGYGQAQPGYGQAPAYGPPVVINNNISNVAAYGMRRPRRRQSAVAHLALFFLTAGIGNVFYALSVSKQNRRNGW